MHVRSIKTETFKEGQALVSFVKKYIPRVRENTIIAVTSKIVALSENRTVKANSKRKARLIRDESEVALRSKHVWLTLKDGAIMANAGIDESNANGKLILLPKDSFKTAAWLRKQLKRLYGVKRLGVLITDSRVAPLRKGVTGVALGYAGFKGKHHYRGTRDLFGRKFKFSEVNIADSLATSAVLIMGEGRERTPLAIIEGAPFETANIVRRNELVIDPQNDLYRPVIYFPKKRRR